MTRFIAFRSRPSWKSIARVEHAKAHANLRRAVKAERELALLVGTLDLISSLSPQESMAVKDILEAMHQAKAKWPAWVSDPIHAAAILAEEAGETVQASMDMVYGGKHANDIVKEAAQTGAMAIRLISGIRRYKCESKYLDIP